MTLSYPASDLITGTILIVDNALDTRRLPPLLSQAGHRVRRVTEGQQALQDAIFDPPDLILLDIALPTMSGYELCGLLKAMNSTQDIPIIFLSTNDEPLYKVQAFRFGAVDYITKPFDTVDLLVRVETQLKIRRQHLQSQSHASHLQTQNHQLQQKISSLLAIQTRLEELNRELEAKLQFYQSEQQDANPPLLPQSFPTAAHSGNKSTNKISNSALISSLSA